MPDFWLDSDSLMVAKDGPYAFDLVPAFWEFIDQKAVEGIVATSEKVYEEIMNAYEDDPLRVWAQARQGEPLFRTASEAVQLCVNEVADYVQNNYAPEWAARFFKGADPWLIAHAKAEGGRVVTFEIMQARVRKNQRSRMCASPWAYHRRSIFTRCSPNCERGSGDVEGLTPVQATPGPEHAKSLALPSHSPHGQRARKGHEGVGSRREV